MQFLYSMAMVALIGLGLWLLYLSREPIRFGLASYKWATADGIIVDSYDDSFTTDGLDSTGTGIVPVTNKATGHLYEYQVQGRMFRSSTYCFGGHVDDAGAAYLIGTPVKVYYDPHDPQRAVLKRGIQFGALFGIMPLAGGIFMALRLILG